MDDRTLTVGSVCSGIGAPETAWAPLGWDFLWTAEIEPFPSAVLAARFQGVPNLGDMTTIAPRILAGEIAAPDILVGGTPCQSFSVAGLRGGLSDERGNLALEFVRLAEAIDTVRFHAGKPPAWILWENVPGVLSDGGNAFGTFLAGLVGGDAPLVPRGRWTDAGVVAGPFRCAAWRILDAQFFGLAQRRERVFVLARGGAASWSCADALLPVIEGVRWHPAPRREAREAVARLRLRALQAVAGIATTPTPPTTSSPGGGNNTTGPIDVATALNACATAAGRQDFESETFVTQVAPTLQANGKAAGSATQQDAETGMLIAHTLRADGFDASATGTGRGTPLVAVAATLSAGGHGGRRKEDDVNLVAFVQNQRDEVRELSVAGSLAAEPGMKQQTYVAGGMAVRRLMPLECERLQGFDDGSTAVLYRAKPAADGPRYRALGNSMAVPVLRWIGEQIARWS